VLYTH